MGTRYALVCAVIVFVHPLVAQVTIPDPAFAAALEAAVPDAVTGDQLDQDHPSVLALTNLSLPDAGVSNINGVQYFSALEYLDISSNPVSSMPALPASLGTLDISGTLIASLPVLPSGLHTLYMGGTPIAVVQNLPSGLTLLDLTMCNAPQLGTLPAGLTHLYLYNCGYTAPPVIQGPTGLATLYLSWNPVQTITALPSSLISFECDECGLTSLPALPSGLENLWVPNNAIAQLPALPDGLIALNCTNDPLTALPALPSGLTELRIENAPLSETGDLPPGLLVLQASGSGLLCVPNVPATLYQMELPVSLECIPEPMPPAAEDYAWAEGFPVPELCSNFNAFCELKPYIAGSVFHDANGNGLNDDGGGAMPFANLVVQPGGLMTGSSSGGLYSTHVLPGSYTVEVMPGGYQVATTGPQAAEVPDYTTTILDNDHGMMLQPGITDMQVQYTSFSEVRPGFAFSGRITYQNIGSEDASGAVTFTHDAAITFFGADPAPTLITGNTLTWDYSAISLGAPGIIDVDFAAPMDVPLGTALSHMATISTTATDAQPGNNQDVEQQVVIGSFDPNDKRVVPTSLTPEDVAAGTPVRYTIRFQNTGTAEAFMVRIKDQLDPRLDVAGFRFLSSSHACDWFIESGELVLVFADINLPDSTSDEPGSHGFVTFEITTVQSLMLGESVANEAAIYFDFNEPVITAPAVFTVENSTGVSTRVVASVAVSPNPVNERLMVRTAIGSGTWQVLDATGRGVMSGAVRGEMNVLDVEGLPSGAYIVQVRSESVMGTARFVKR